MRVSENRVLRKILGSKRYEIRGKLRRLHERGLLTKCYSCDQSKKNGMCGECSKYRRQKMQDIILVGRAERRRSLARLMRRWDDNITMDLQETEWKHGLD
jgi:recombinational DNA repair protein RecR